MAVRRSEPGSPESALTGVGSRDMAEPGALAADHGRCAKYSNTVDSDNGENTIVEVSSGERFNRYVDCQETLVELSFIKWLSGFREECRRSVCLQNRDLFYGLLNFFHVNIAPEIFDCRNKVNKSTLLKTYVEQALIFFHNYHKQLQDPLYVIYYDKMSSLLAYYIDLKLMASQRFEIKGGKDKSWSKKVSSKISTALFVFLDSNVDLIFDTLFQLYYLFYGSINIPVGSIMLPIFKKLLIEYRIPQELKFLTYLRYIICFKLWKKTVSGSSLSSVQKRKELEQIRFTVRKLTPPRDFMEQHQKYNWPNWPKLTISLNSSPDMINMDLKKVNTILYTANLSLKDCIKDVLDISRKDIPRLMKPIIEQCVTLRPDLYSIDGKEVLNDWISKFDKTLKPLIPVTRSCNSLIRQIKYNLYNETKTEIIETTSDDDINVSYNLLPQNDNTTLINPFEVKREIFVQRLKQNTSVYDDQSTIISNNYNSFNNQMDNKQPSRVLKTVYANSELASPNELSKNNEMEVNVVKSKLSDKHIASYTNKTDTESSSHHTHSSGSSSYALAKGSKRNKPPCLNGNEVNKRSCRSKTRHERNIASGKLNPNIGTNSQNMINKNTSCNYNSLLEHSKNNLDINALACLLNTSSSSRENIWPMKSLNPEKYMHGSMSERNRDGNLGVCTSKMNNANSDRNGIASPSSEAQWSIKSPSELDSLVFNKPLMVNNSERMDVETMYSDTEGNQTVEHLLSLRSINENENTQIYALPMEQKLNHIEHSYVENAIASNTRDLEVVNVLSPVSINSTDIPISKSSWVPDISAHLHNDVDGDHSQSSTQLNGLCNSIGINKNCAKITNHHNEMNHLSHHMQLETAHMPRPLSSYNLIESRLYSDDPFLASLSPNGSSISNSGYNSIYEMSRVPIGVPVKSVPVPMSSKDIHEFNDSNSIYHGNTLNLSFNGLKNKVSEGNQANYNFAMNNTRPTGMSIGERISPSNPSNKDIHNILEVVSDEFSDMDSMDLRINNTENRDINSCINSLSMSSLISSDLKSSNPFNSFEKSANWSTIKNPPSDLHQKQHLKVYTDPTKLVPGHIHLNTQLEMPFHLNETRVQKAFLGNKSPSQLYYSPMADFCISSDVDTVNHGIIEDPQQNNFNNRSNIRDRLQNTCTNDKYIHSLMPPMDNDLNGKQQTLISNYDGVHNQNSPIMNHGLLYKFCRSDNPSISYASPIQLHHTNPDCLSPQCGHNGLTYTSFDQIRGPTLLEDPKQKEDSPSIINLPHLVPQSNTNCKVHYKWPLTKKKSQTSTTSNEKIQEPTHNSEYKRNSNVAYKYIDDEFNLTRLQNVSPNELLNQNSSLSFSERKTDGPVYQSNQQFQDISNLIDTDLSPVIQCGSETPEEKKANQARIIVNFEKNLRKESIDFEAMYRISKISGKSHEPNSPLSHEIFESARSLFNKNNLFVCIYPKCVDKIHFRVIPSNAELLRHEFTVPFDDFRFNIQYKYKQLLISTLKVWPIIPELVQLAKRCMCEICCDFDSKLNQNQDMLSAFVDGRRKPGVDGNNENQPQIKPRIKLSWKKNLAHRFRSEAVAKKTISQMIDDMQMHINSFNRAFTTIFPLTKDLKTNTETLKKACENNINHLENSLNSDCLAQINMANSVFDKEVHLFSYQYVQLPKITPKYVLEDKSNSPYQQANQNMSSFSHQFDEEHLPNEMNRYYVESSSSPSSQSIHSNLTSPPPIRYIHENVPISSHQPAVENLPSTSHQSSVGNITNSHHKSVLNHFPTTSQCQEISLEMCSLNERPPQNLSHIPRYYSDGQMYSEFPPHTYLQVPSSQFQSSSTNSYYGSPVNMPSDTSVPFHSPSLSVNSVPNSPSSDCSIPSLVESAATAVPEHTLLDDSLEAVNAAHNLMMISHRHRYNSSTSITPTNTTHTMTIATTATTNAATVLNSNSFKTPTKSKKISPTDTIAIKNISPPRTLNNDVSVVIVTDAVQPSITEPEDQEPEVVHNSRKKKKKKHDKKKDKKKKGKR